MAEKKREIQKILVIGFNTRHIVCSGRRAGYEVYASDAFGDVDLRRCAKEFFPLGEIPSLDVDGIILGSGFERIDFRYKRLCNEREKMEKVLNKRWLSEKLSKLGIPHPELYTSDMVYPAMAKPIYGGGGMENFLIEKEEDLEKVPDNFIIQEFVQGIPASVSLISTQEKVISIAVNEQLIGERWLGQKRPFGYCGNITPLITSFEREMREIAEEIIFQLELVGSNGVDFVVSEKGPYVIEVNPRFQGSLDTVELSTGINLFDAHIRAFKGELIHGKKPERFAMKATVFAEKRVRVTKNLDMDGIVDIPPIGRIIEEGDPISTAIGIGSERKSAYEATLKNVSRIKKSCTSEIQRKMGKK
ncbi:MAG: ATP-grasp domain-containing protein [Candidatus Syntropharchaeia archaeon]